MSTKKGCTCSVNSDLDMGQFKKILRKTDSLTAEDIVLYFAALEATDHRRDCSYYGVMLEACEMYLICKGLS